MRLDVAMRPIEAVSHHVRVATQIAPGRPALWIGLRMAAAMAVPLVLSPWLAPPTATAASLAGYFITLVDKGGAYRTRARAMGLASLVAVIGVVVGVLVAGTPLAAPVVVAAFTLCAFGHLRGAAGASIVNPGGVLLAIAAFRPASAATLLEAIAGTAFGAGWAMLLALWLWPVRVYRPGRVAIAHVLDELGGLAAAIANGDDRSTLLPRHRMIREQLELARETVVASRRGRGERSRGERLHALVHVADRVFGKLVALEHALSASASSADRAFAVRALHAHAAALFTLSDAILEERGTPALADASRPASLGSGAADHVRWLVEVTAELIAVAGRLIRSLADDGEAAPAVTAPAPEPPPRERLRDIFDLDSAVMRHALRVAIACSVAAVIAAWVHAEFSYWILIAVFLLLQPHRATTTARTIQRGLGTIAGALIAAALVVLVPQQAVLIGITIACAAIGASMLQLNYGLFSLFVTPTFVLLAEIHTQDFTLVGVRVAYTLLAGVIAFVASAALWPARERARFDDLLAEVITATASYIAVVGAAIATRAPMPSLDIARARRALGLALGNAEVALDRMTAERAAASIIEPRMSAIAAVRRLSGAVNVLGSIRSRAALDPRRAEIAQQAGVVERQLRELVAALRAQPMGRIDAAIDALRVSLERAQIG